MSATLPVRLVEKPWGRPSLPAPFSTTSRQRIGEIWFEPPAELPDLLIKYIFTSEPLSVQVHPSDIQTLANGMGRQGKEECWLVISAEPGAQLGIGFKEPTAPGVIRDAALDGSIEHMIAWHQVRPGDFFYIPANTVHAIGAGIGLIEVQQNSDITYRLYDYGRPRALHLEDAMAISNGDPYPALYRSRAEQRQTVTLVDGPCFKLDQIAGPPSPDLAARYSGPFLIIPREGCVTIEGETVASGGCAVASSMDAVSFEGTGVYLLATGF